MHIAIIKSDGIESAKVFDTNKGSFDFNEFTDKLLLSKGDIVIAASKDDCEQGLNDHAKKWFQDLGSRQIDYL